MAIKAAAGKFIELCIKVSDNNVKLIVLDKVDQLRRKNQGVLDDLVMEVLRVLSRYEPPLFNRVGRTVFLTCVSL